MSTTTYLIQALRAEGWELIERRASRQAAGRVLDRLAARTVEPANYIAGRIVTAKAVLIEMQAVNAPELDLSEAQCEALADLAGDGDLVAEIATEVKRRAETATATAKRSGTPRAPRKNGPAYTRGNGAKKASSIRYYTEGPLAGLHASSSQYVACHRVNGQWQVLRVYGGKRRAINGLLRNRTPAVTAEAIYAKSGTEVYTWVAGDAPIVLRAAVDSQSA